MPTARTVVVVLILALAPAGAGLGAPPVGPFQDASDDRSDPTELEATGTYEGQLFPPGDEDWYRLLPEASAGGPTCVEVAFSGEANARANLTTPHGEAYVAEANLTPDQPASMGLAGHGFDGATFGLHPFQPLRSLGAYEFTVDTVHLSDGVSDEGPPDDVADEGPCLVQDLRGDGQRTLTFNASEGDRLTLSLAQPSDAAVSIALQDPSDRSRGEIGPANGDTGVIHETINESGTWTIQASNMQGSSASYLLGVSLADDCQLFCGFQDDDCDEDDEEDECDDEQNRPCQPKCMRS